MLSSYLGTTSILTQRKESNSSRSQVSAHQSNCLFLCKSLSIEKVRDTRSLFRLFKFLSELKRIQIITSVSQDKFSLITNISSRAFYFFYWLFDNIYIILKCMDFHHPKLDKEWFRQLSRIFWLLGLLLFLIYCIKTLRKTYTDESDLKVAALNKMTVKQMKDNL